MSAEVLRRAASLMRERAEAASESPWSCQDQAKWYGGGPAWEVAYIPTDGLCAGEEVQVSGGSDEEDARHIASWHPVVARAVAELLDRAADDHDETPCPAVDAALAVARAYLGSDAS